MEIRPLRKYGEIDAFLISLSLFFIIAVNWEFTYHILNWMLDTMLKGDVLSGKMCISVAVLATTFLVPMLLGLFFALPGKKAAGEWAMRIGWMVILVSFIFSILGATESHQYMGQGSGAAFYLAAGALALCILSLARCVAVLWPWKACGGKYMEEFWPLFFMDEDIDAGRIAASSAFALLSGAAGVLLGAPTFVLFVAMTNIPPLIFNSSLEFGWATIRIGGRGKGRKAAKR